MKFSRFYQKITNQEKNSKASPHKTPTTGHPQGSFVDFEQTFLDFHLNSLFIAIFYFNFVFFRIFFKFFPKQNNFLEIFDLFI